MRSENVAILVLFTLLLILIYKLYFKRSMEQFWWFGDSRQGETYVTFDKISKVTPYRSYTPETIEEIQKIITDNPGRKIRTAGDNYTFNDIFFTNDIILRTNNMHNIIYIDTDKKEIHVQTGCLIKDVCSRLEEAGLALDSPPQTLQTIGSACSTAAHGSNLNTGTMSDQIVNLTVVLGNGHIRRVEFDDPEFPAYATGLGGLGIIYSITLKCVDYYLLSTFRKEGKWDTIKKRLLEWLDEYNLSYLHINPSSLQTTVFLRKAVGDTSVAQEQSRKTPDTKLGPSRDTLSSEKLYTKSKVAVPHVSVIDAVNDVLKLCQSHKKISGYECDKITVSFTGPDYHSWLSPASGRASAWIEAITAVPLKNKDKTMKFMQDYEDLLLYKYSGRPDWTTTKFANAYKMRLLYGISIDYYRRVRDRFDSEHVLTNDFIEKIIGSA